MIHDHPAPHAHAGHAHAGENFGRVFAIATALNVALVVAEFTGGFLAHSLALIADAAHNLFDVIGLLLAWGGAWLARRPATGQRTYGYRRATILAALGNAALLLIAVGGIGIEAVRRLFEHPPVATGTVLALAGIGIVVNGAT